MKRKMSLVMLLLLALSVMLGACQPVTAPAAGDAAAAPAKLILATDAELATPRGQALRTLLYMFEADEAVRLFRAA